MNISKLRHIKVKKEKYDRSIVITDRILISTLLFVVNDASVFTSDEFQTVEYRNSYNS
jgi:hypothetical protein